MTLNDWHKKFIQSLTSDQKKELMDICLTIVTKFTDFGCYVEAQNESQRAKAQFEHAKSLLKDMIEELK